MINISPELSGIIAGDEKVPVGLVHIYNTSYTVPSNGLFVSYFSGINPLNSGTIKRTQFEPIIMNDWSNGLPVELSNYVGARITNSGQIISDPFAIIYTGYFNAKTSGTYNFATRSNGGVELFINNSQVLSGSQLITPGMTGYSSGMWSGKQYYWEGNTNLNTGWYNFKLNFYWSTLFVTGTIGGPFLTAFYRPPNEVDDIVLSASTVNYQSGFLQPTILSNFMMASENVDEDLSTQFDFEVSMGISGDYTWNKARQDFGQLRINRLCKIFMGYVTESGYSQTNGYTRNLDRPINGLIEKFTGLIDDVAVAQTKDSLTASVKCRDFSKKLINGLNENYPNKANYTKKVLDNVDKYGIFNINSLMPNTYDAWSAFNVIETLALNGGIDPEKINRKKWDIQNHFVLESNLNWPYTSTYDVNGIETKNGDPYLFKYEYGEKLYDEMKTVGDLIGYNVYFDEAGDLVVKEPRRTNRVEIYESGNYGSKSMFYSGNWTMGVNLNTSNRISIAPLQNGSFSTGIFRFSFSGVGASIYETIHSSGNKYSVNIYDDFTNVLVFQSGYTNSGTLRYGSLREFTRDLPLSKYNLFIYPSGDLRLEGAEYYTSNIFRPVYTLKDDRDIISINLENNDYSTRNEIIAVGQQTSDKGYLYSKAIDLDSISNPEAFNYVGEKRTVTIIEPTIQSQQRLDWLARSVLQKFNRKSKNITLETQGLPHLQINDPVGIKSDKLILNSDTVPNYGADNEEVYYVTNLASALSRGKYTTNITLTSLKPIESWRPPISITNDILKLIYDSNNNSIFANFRQDTLNTAIATGYGYNGFSEQAAFVSFDLLVDVDRLWVLISDTADGGPIFKNIDVKSTFPLLTYQIAQGNKPNQPPQGAVWLHNGGGERWGRITVPTAQNTFNGGQWAGQNSAANIRLDGEYPLAIWAQFRTSDNANVFQGIWVPPSGTLDNRNRSFAWSTTSSGNTFISYATTAGGQVVTTPINPTLQQAYLPAFRVQNEDLEIDLWVGPPASGYRMVSKNRLVSMSGNFQYGGDYWNPGQVFFSDINNFKNDINEHVISGTEILLPGIPRAPYTSKVRVSKSPWVTGDNVLFGGEPPSVQEILNELTYKINSIPSPPGGRVIDKRVFGFANQGFDVKTFSRDVPYLFNTGLIPFNINNNASDPVHQGYRFDYGAAAGQVITGIIETVNHVDNFITIATNHDLLLTYTSVILYASRQLENKQVYCLGSYAHNFNVPFKNNVAIYAAPGGTNGIFDRIYKDENHDNFSPANNMSVFNYQGVTFNEFNTIMQNGEYGRLNDRCILHYFTLVESKTGRKFFFTTRTNLGFVYKYQGGQQIYPYGYQRHLHMPTNITNINDYSDPVYNNNINREMNFLPFGNDTFAPRIL